MNDNKIKFSLRDKLKNKIQSLMKVRIIETRLGSLIIEPVSSKRAEQITRYAKMNGAPKNFEPQIFLQDSQDVQHFLEFHPNARFGKKDPETGHYEINDGKVMIMDGWQFCQMVGYMDF
jgi:hypothetical protein